MMNCGYQLWAGPFLLVCRPSKQGCSEFCCSCYLFRISGLSFIIDILIPETLDCVCITRIVGSSIIWWKLER